MALTPSPARRLIVPRRDASPRGFVPAPLRLRWPDKGPADRLDYSLDLTALLDPGDTVSAFSAAVSPSLPGGLVIDATAVGGAVAIVWLGDGVAGVEYDVQMSISSAAGRYLSCAIALRVDHSTTL